MKITVTEILTGDNLNRLILAHKARTIAISRGLTVSEANGKLLKYFAYMVCECGLFEFSEIINSIDFEQIIYLSDMAKQENDIILIAVFDAILKEFGVIE